MAYTFEWDETKAERNIIAHGVSFDEAASAFGDPLSLLMPDPDHSAMEERYLLVGRSAPGRLLVVAFGERTPNTPLISARLAARRERRRYEEEP
ncbi:MAG: BrnT family toxin [Armatimonadetes bacterium]|nr:BrnT family toxin [Armatimonadota bacterium]